MLFLYKTNNFFLFRCLMLVKRRVSWQKSSKNPQDYILMLLERFLLVVELLLFHPSNGFWAEEENAEMSWSLCNRAKFVAWKFNFVDNPVCKQKEWVYPGISSKFFYSTPVHLDASQSLFQPLLPPFLGHCFWNFLIKRLSIWAVNEAIRFQGIRVFGISEWVVKNVFW